MPAGIAAPAVGGYLNFELVAGLPGWRTGSMIALAKKNGEAIMIFLTRGGEMGFRLSEWGPAMEHGEPGQVGNQAALNCPFLVSDSIPAGDFLRLPAADLPVQQDYNTTGECYSDGDVKRLCRFKENINPWSHQRGKGKAHKQKGVIHCQILQAKRLRTKRREQTKIPAERYPDNNHDEYK